MKLTKVVLKCLSKRCDNKVTLDHMPTEQPLCEKCYMPMTVYSVKAAGR
jgi:hypothetical protein